MNEIHVLSCKACGGSVNAPGNDLCSACMAAVYACLPKQDQRRLRAEAHEKRNEALLIDANEDTIWATICQAA